MRLQLILIAAIATGVALVPSAALAQAVAAGSGAIPYLAIASILWFAADKIIDLLPIRESTLIQKIRSIINVLLAGKRQ